MLATDIADAVTGAGGLIFDHASTGWTVTVHLEDGDDELPLHILGVRAGVRADLLDASEPDLEAVFVSAELMASNARVRRHWASAGRRGGIQVAVWGAEWPMAPASAQGLVEHPLSVAARAFKRHALIAAGVGTAPAALECFHTDARNGGRFS
ncbi:hypothetical protein [Mycobacterium sp. ACS4331]|uniref:hypothetical protein n=1 Tax=Mycobacterium sp. ACS4331 TaxID=1834121 RepID=UPI0007FEFE14|nr:hypothetical protein [Mycobacterium sp. ACS4331]OBF20387.1 hypothetical protein A5727_09335 [Mycobacterium sp. ACS4331]